MIPTLLLNRFVLGGIGIIALIGWHFWEVRLAYKDGRQEGRVTERKAWEDRLSDVRQARMREHSAATTALKQHRLKVQILEREKRDQMIRHQVQLKHTISEVGKETANEDDCNFNPYTARVDRRIVRQLNQGRERPQ